MPEPGCVTEDSIASWGASGSLNPGETFSYTTPNGDCSNQRAIRVIVSSGQRDPSSSWVELSTVIPGAVGYYGAGTKIYATTHDDSSAELCMFPSFPYLAFGGSPQTYSFTLKNISNKTINHITITGKDNNDWTPSYVQECFRSDADNDGFSDAIEHSMWLLTNGDPSMSGSDYVKSCGTTAADDEYDFNPADFNDDGKVDSTDVDRITARLGEGSGVPLRSITDQYPDAPNGFHTQSRSWRRFDLDTDGLVTQDDVNLVKALVGRDLCATGNPVLPADTTPPGVAITAPWFTTVPKGSSSPIIAIQALAVDNVKVAKVEFYINGSLKCTDTVAAASTYECSWTANGKAGTKYNLQAKAYDGVGNSSSSRVLTVTSF